MAAPKSDGRSWPRADDHDLIGDPNPDMPQLLDAFAGRSRLRITSLAVVTLGLGLLALAAPVSRAEFPAARVGWLLTLAAGLELLHAMRQSNADARRRATIGGVISMAIAIFLINAPFVAARGLRLLVAGWFAVDAVRYAIGTFRRTDGTERALAALAALGNTALGAAASVRARFGRGVGRRGRRGGQNRRHRLEHRHGAGLYHRRCRGHRRA